MTRGNFKSPTPKGLEAIAKANRERALKRRREQMQDLEFMASTNETTEGAAERFGITREALWKRVDKAKRTDLWDQLRANEVRRFGAELHEIRAIERAGRVKGTLRGPRQAA